MITQIHLSNFKCFTNIIIPLKPMTLLAGLNNSGKSSVIQAFRMLQKWADTGDMTLPGHGSVRDLKNINASSSDYIGIAFISDKNKNAECKIAFSDIGKPEISSKKAFISNFPLFSYISADRWGPRVSLPLNTDMEDLMHVGEHGEYVIDFLSRHEGDAVAPALLHSKSEGETVEYNVRAWLEEISPNIEFNHGSDRKRDTSYAMIDEFRPTNTGFGLSYTLPVIVALLGMSAQWKDKRKERHKSEKGVLVLLENPEAHLHPKGQTEIGRMIVCAAASGVQVIVETHSDHLMDGIRIAVKEGLIDAEKTAFHYFAKRNKYESTITSPKLHANGKLDFWPEGFFDQTLKNRAKLARRS